jgi:hypothetical protein
MGKDALPEIRQWHTHEWHMTATLDAAVVSLNQYKYTYPMPDVSSKGPTPSPYP